MPHYFGVPARRAARNPTWVFRDYTNGGSDTVTVTLDFPTLTIAKTTGMRRQPGDRQRRSGGSRSPGASS